MAAMLLWVADRWLWRRLLPQAGDQRLGRDAWLAASVVLNEVSLDWCPDRIRWCPYATKTTHIGAGLVRLQPATTGRIGWQGLQENAFDWSWRIEVGAACVAWSAYLRHSPQSPWQRSAEATERRGTREMCLCCRRGQRCLFSQHGQMLEWRLR